MLVFDFAIPFALGYVAAVYTWPRIKTWWLGAEVAAARLEAQAAALQAKAAAVKSAIKG